MPVWAVDVDGLEPKVQSGQYDITSPKDTYEIANDDLNGRGLGLWRSRGDTTWDYEGAVGPETTVESVPQSLYAVPEEQIGVGQTSGLFEIAGIKVAKGFDNATHQQSYHYYNGKDWKPYEPVSQGHKDYQRQQGVNEFCEYCKNTTAFVGTFAVSPGTGAFVGRSVVGGGQSLVQRNMRSGNLFRDELAAAMRAEGRTVNTEVYKSTPYGRRFIDLDIWENGVNLGGIETKVGSSRYHSMQKIKDNWLISQGYPVQLVRKPANW